MKTAVKKAVQTIETDPATAGDDVKRAQSLIAHTASKRTIHKRQAARRQSRLMRQLNAANAALKPAEEPVVDEEPETTEEPEAAEQPDEAGE